MSSTLSRSLSATPLNATRQRWADAWFQSDLVGVPVTLAFSGAIAISFGLYLVVDKSAGLLVGQLFFPLAILGPLGVLLRCGRQGETIEGMQVASTTAAQRRVLVLANAGLEHPQARADLFRLAARAEKAMIIAPVAAATWLHALADDVDSELRATQMRVEAVVAALRLAGVNAVGRADVAPPARALIDGLREFAATEILVLPSAGKSWTKASTLAEQIQAELSLGAEELNPAQMSLSAA